MITLINLSDLPDKALMPTIEWIVNDLKLTCDIKFIYQQVWADYDIDSGEIIPNTEQPDIIFDADACTSGIVRVCISKTMTWPYQWNINKELKGEYLNGASIFENWAEFFVYVVSHEIFHEKEFAHPKEHKRTCNFLNTDSEALADFYAIRNLVKYRYGNYKN
jgi:hypothetical protein